MPDDVQPVPRAIASSHSALTDAGGMATVTDGATGRATELAHVDRPPECTDNRHHTVRVRQIAADRWVIARGVLDTLRNDKAQLTPQVDAAGRVTGLLVEDIGSGCLAALGFRTGDLIHSVNGQSLDWATYYLVYRAVYKDGSAVVRFERGGRALTVVYELGPE
jgi:hypothetical protein